MLVTVVQYWSIATDAGSTLNSIVVCWRENLPDNPGNALLSRLETAASLPRQALCPEDITTRKDRDIDP